LRGYMPSDKHYRDFFVTPIERDGDSERKRLLAAYIRPFILRRRKQDVLKDLPKKTEEVGHADLFPEQRELYDAVITESRARLFADLED
ncbi:MAG: serine/threonine protein phosphatase, partial [Chlamydiia bacterium]|nr:serine/threonine protein phosphatase [Chlamydiia bacterium]